MKAILVSAGDAAYYPLLRDWVDSVHDAGLARDFDVGVLDFGFTVAQRAELDGRVRRVEPSLSVDPGRSRIPPDPLRAYTERIFLPRHLPGYDVYVWMDADTWVQQADAVELFAETAAAGSLAAVAECHPAYRITGTVRRPETVLGIPYRFSSYYYRKLASCFGSEVAAELSERPVVNSGAFGLRGDAPHWAAWGDALQRALKRSRKDGWDQATLNWLVYRTDLPVDLLPARCNWLPSLAMPLLHPDSGQLVEPYAPRTPLGVVHLAVGSKDPGQRIRTLDGASHEISLRYGDRAGWPRRPG